MLRSDWLRELHCFTGFRLDGSAVEAVRVDVPRPELACIERRMASIIESTVSYQLVAGRYTGFERTVKKASDLYRIGSPDSMRRDGRAFVRRDEVQPDMREPVK